MEKGNINTQSVNVRNGAVLFKQMFVETLLFFQKIFINCPVWIWRSYKFFWNINQYIWHIWCLEWTWYWNSSWKKRGEYLISLITDDDRSLSVLRKFSKKFKESFPSHTGKHNLSLNLWNDLNTKIFDYFMMDNKQEPWYDSKPSAYG